MTDSRPSCDSQGCRGRLQHTDRPEDRGDQINLQHFIERDPSAKEHVMTAAMRSGVFGSVLLLIVGCGPASVQRVSGPTGQLPRPDRILVYDFAVTPDEVRLDSGVGSQLVQLFGSTDPGTSRTAEEIKIGHAVANAVAAALVNELNKYGLPAARALGPPTPGGRLLMVKGQFVSIDEG